MQHVCLLGGVWNEKADRLPSWKIQEFIRTYTLKRPHLRSLCASSMQLGVCGWIWANLKLHVLRWI